MDIEKMIDLSDCTICGGAALLEEENKGYYVSCLDCGSQSVHVAYKSDSDEDRLEAAKKTAMLWNSGKVINSNPGE